MATINPNQDYDIIYTLTFVEASGDCPIRLYRGSTSTYTGTVYYRAGTSGDWTTLSVSGTSTTFPVTSTTMQVAHDWNKSGNNYMTPSFQGATNITSIAISQKSVLTGSMGDYFMYRYAYGCSSLTSLDVPDTSGFTSVGSSFMYYYARGCSSLTSLAVPDTSGLTSVGDYFMYYYAYGCSSLTSLAVPDTSGLTSVGNIFMSNYAYGCSSLTSLAVPDTSGLTSVGSSFMYYYAYGCSSLTSLAVPDTSGLTRVGNSFMRSYAYNCSSLTSLAVPDTSGLTSVGNYFMQYYAYGCSSLTELVLPAVGWFEDNDVDWSVPSSRLGNLKGRVLNSDDLSSWQALTAEGKTLYTNYIRDPDLVYYGGTEPAVIRVTTLPVTDITTSSARLRGEIEVGEGELPFWLDFVPQYNDTGFNTNTETIPKDCILYMDINGVMNVDYKWIVNGESIIGWAGITAEWLNRTISVKKGDTLSISSTRILDTELRDTMILRLDGATGEKVAEFDFVLEPSCYLTTAMVGYFGKDDDGIELNSMRALRSHSGHKYPDVLDEYHRVSPQIIQGIEQSGQQEYYYGIIKDVVENIVALVANEEWQQAEQAYLDLYNWLKGEFKIYKTIIEVIPLEGEELYSAYFQYRKKGASTWLETAKQTVTVDGTQTFDAIVENLDDNTEYEYRAVTDYGGESYFGEILTFKTKLSTEYCEYNADTKRPITQSQNYQADTFRKVNKTYQYSADTERITLKDYDYAADVLRRIAEEAEYQADMVRQIAIGQEFKADTLRQIVIQQEFTADAIRQVIQSQGYNADTKRQVLKTYEHNADTLRKVLAEQEFAADALRKVLREDAYFADTLREIVVIAADVYLADTVRQIIAEQEFIADAKRMIIKTDAHNADLLRHIVKQYQYTADTMRFVVELGVCIGDTYRVVRADQVYNADALRQAIKEYEFIADTLRRIERPYIRLKVTLSVQEREVGLGLQERKPSLSIQEREVKLEVEE